MFSQNSRLKKEATVNVFENNFELFEESSSREVITCSRDYKFP